MSRSWRQIGGVFAAACLAVCSLPSLSAPQPLESAQTLENSLARAYLYIISRTTWPTGSGEPLNFCINRNHSLFDSFAKIVPTLEKLSIKLIDENDPEVLRKCHIVILHQDRRFAEVVLKTVRGLPILSMSHEADLTEEGALVYLSYGQRLEPPKINLKELEASHLRIDASILDLSRRRWGQ